MDKALAIRDQCPKLEKIIWDDPKGLRHYDDPMLISLDEVMKLGREKDKEDPGLFDRMVAQAKGDDVCLLFYTSGTTALPKGALLTHYNMLTMGRNLMRVDPCTPDDDFVSYLPFAWIGEQMMSISCGLQVGFTINFPEEPEIAQANVREIGPHVMFAPPRLYEQMTRTVQVKHLDATWIKRKTFEMAMKIGYHTAELKFEKKPVPFYWKFLRFLANLAALPEDPGSSGAEQGPSRIYGRCGHGTGPFPVFPCHRCQPEADLRPDGDCRHFRGAS